MAGGLAPPLNAGRLRSKHGAGETVTKTLKGPIRSQCFPREPIEPDRPYSSLAFAAGRAHLLDMDNTALEERIAHLLRVTDDLSDTVARQAREIDRLTARVERLMLREAEREAEGTGGIILGDERPPHY